MPHLLSYQNGSSRHLARWNATPSGVYRHLGAGGVALTLSRDTYKNFIWGDYYHQGSVDKASGCIAAFGSAGGEKQAMALLESRIIGNNSAWPYQGNEWNTQNVDYPYWFHCGYCVSGRGTPETTAEAAMGVCAYHFTVPTAYRNKGLSLLDAQIVWNGYGSFVQNITRLTTQPMFYPTYEWDMNNDIWGTQRRLKADTYTDSQGVAVHFIPGNQLSKAIFPPSRCFYVYDNTTSHRAFEHGNLLYSFQRRVGRVPSKSELLRYFNIDMDDEQNSHLVNFTFAPSRSTDPSASNRFKSHVWANQHGGSQGYWDLYTAGSGWRLPVVQGASDYPQTGETLFPDLTLNETQKSAMMSDTGGWFIIHGIPQLSNTNYTGGSYFPSSASQWEFFPWQGASNTSAYGKYLGVQTETINTFKLRVLLG